MERPHIPITQNVLPERRWQFPQKVKVDRSLAASQTSRRHVPGQTSVLYDVKSDISSAGLTYCGDICIGSAGSENSTVDVRKLGNCLAARSFETKCVLGNMFIVVRSRLFPSENFLVINRGAVYVYGKLLREYFIRFN